MHKIVYITHHAPIPSRRADPVCVMNTCHSLAKIGYHIDLIVPNNQGESSLLNPGESIFSFYDVEENFTLRYLPAKLLYKLGFLGRIIYKLMSVLYGISLKPDIVYCRHLEIAIMSIILNKQTIYAAHGVEVLSKKLFFPLWVKLAQWRRNRVMMISVTNYAAQSLIRYGFPESQIVIAPNGVRIEAYDLDLKDNPYTKLLSNRNYEKLVVFSGSLYPGRGIEELIEAASHLPNLHFVIIGGYPGEIKQYSRYTDKKNLHNITFLGYQRPKDLPQLILYADILVMPYTTSTPTKNDMSPMKMFDYLASGRPIITTDFLVLHEILKDKVNAIFVEPDSGPAIAEGIQWCLEHPGEADKIGKNAKAESLKYSWDNRAIKISNAIENTLQYQ